MTISYNWLKAYLPIDLPAERVAELLTDTGLEVEGIEKIESIKGGLEGVVIGAVLTCEQHPNADRLKVTTVDVGTAEPLHIVCGAPNVAVGQKVLVATIGCTLYGFEEPLKIKKGKIRGEVSEGMICAEDELGLGHSHEGIMVLPADAQVGTPAKDYFSLETDFVFEIGLTPNRTDAMSHYGVARDLRAALHQHGEVAQLSLPKVDFVVDDQSLTIPVVVEDEQACSQYYGVTLSNIAVKPSPNWLQNKLRAIGVKPINNVVDVTNFVLHETGHPLHAFDAQKIHGQKVIVKNLDAGTTFTTLDAVERKLHQEDLMICNAEGPMCIAGVFGGIDSGVTENTTSVFLESALFNSVRIRKTAKRHALNTDASYRYERGVDPNMTAYALKRAAMLIKEVAGGQVSSDVQIAKSAAISQVSLYLSHDYLNKLIGNSIPANKVEEILKDLEFELTTVDGGWDVVVPTYRVDVTRPADVVEEFLRIYGFNNVALPKRMQIAISNQKENDFSSYKTKTHAFLTSNGYFEIINNSLTKLQYYQQFAPADEDKLVRILNPLSQDLGVMRQNLLFGALEVVAHNSNRQQNDIRLYEFGNVYFKSHSGTYQEEEQLCIVLSGNDAPEAWNHKPAKSSFYQLKGIVGGLLTRFGINQWDERVTEKAYVNEALILSVGRDDLVSIGQVSDELLGAFSIDQQVFTAIVNWQKIGQLAASKKVTYKELPRFPEVRRDLALLLDENVTYNSLYKTAQKAGGALLKEINLFDVYVGKNLGEGKKSYAMSFMLQDPNATLTDKRVEAVMSEILNALEKQCGAKLR